MRLHPIFGMTAAFILYTASAAAQEKPVPLIPAKSQPVPPAFAVKDIAKNIGGNAPILIKDEAIAKTTATSVEMALSQNPALLPKPK